MGPIPILVMLVSLAAVLARVTGRAIRTARPHVVAALGPRATSIVVVTAGIVATIGLDIWLARTAARLDPSFTGEGVGFALAVLGRLALLLLVLGACGLVLGAARAALGFDGGERVRRWATLGSAIHALLLVTIYWSSALGGPGA